MSIRPVDFNGMIQRTQDVSTLKQNEDNRPVVEQQTIFSQEMKKVEQNLHQVVHAQEKENAGYRYDAKEKGNGHYEKEERKKKDTVALANRISMESVVKMLGHTDIRTTKYTRGFWTRPFPKK